MSLNEYVNVASLVLSITLLLSCSFLLRPANGSRPLLVGFMLSALFGGFISVTRTFALQELARPVFGFVLLFWLFSKLWSLYAAALHTPRPFRLIAIRAWFRLFGGTPPDR